MRRILSRLTRSRVVGTVAFWLCEWLDPYTIRRTTSAKLAAGAAIAAYTTLDVEIALSKEVNPPQVAATLAEFRADEWKEVLGVAAGEIRLLELEIAQGNYALQRR